MRKLLLAAFLMLGLSGIINAQNETFKNTICVNGGFSLVGSIISAANGQTSSVPAIQFTYDRGLSSFFSLGAAASYQGMKIDYSDITYGDYKTTISRLNVACRALFHYANSGKLDMYSGLRLGYTNWGVSTTSKDPDYVADDVVKGGGFAPQVILFGIRGYFTDHIGLNFEVGVGAPHYTSIGLAYRL